MKKHLLWIATILVVTVASMNIKVKEIIAPEKAVEKNVALAVYKESDYASDAYMNASATVHITIEKVSNKGRSLVWEKTFDAQMLKQYPSLQEAIAQTVKVPNVFDSKEHLKFLIHLRTIQKVANCKCRMV